LLRLDIGVGGLRNRVPATAFESVSHHGKESRRSDFTRNPRSDPPVLRLRSDIHTRRDADDLSYSGL
jgi:hypothetical protein